MNEIYKTFQDRLDFYLVYIREAHPTDGWQVFSNIDDEVFYAEPTTADERTEVAGVCMLELGFTMATLLDNMANDVDAKYAALPERLYVLDAEGKVFYRGIMGSRGFNVDTWLEAIEAQAASVAVAAE